MRWTPRSGMGPILPCWFLPPRSRAYVPKARPASPVRINSIPKAVKAGILTVSVAPVANHAGKEGAEAWVGVQGRELQRAPEVLDVALAGIDGLLDIVERVAVFAAAGLNAGECGEGRRVSRVSGYGPFEYLLSDLEVVGRVVKARVRVEGAGVRGIRLQRLHEVLLRLLHLPPALAQDAELEVGFRVLGVEAQYRVVGFGG